MTIDCTPGQALTCPCGAQYPRVGVLQTKHNAPGGRYYAACLDCHRVGQHATTPIQACDKWEHQEPLYSGESEGKE